MTKGKQKCFCQLSANGMLHRQKRNVRKFIAGKNLRMIPFEVPLTGWQKLSMIPISFCLLKDISFRRKSSSVSLHIVVHSRLICLSLFLYLTNVPGGRISFLSCSQDRKVRLELDGSWKNLHSNKKLGTSNS